MKLSLPRPLPAGEFQHDRNDTLRQDFPDMLEETDEPNICCAIPEFGVRSCQIFSGMYFVVLRLSCRGL